jgi:photosynthetic reaction center cytochrome c subunit
MTNRTGSLMVGLMVLTSAALIASDQSPTVSASPAPTPLASPAAPPASQSGRAGDRFKNVQVLRDISPSDLYATMHLVRTSLGTTCDHCHDVEHYEADTKPAKVTARRQMQMVLDFNKNVFEGRTAVTCNSCHRGSLRPVSIPTVEQGLFPDSTRGAVVPPRVLPTPAQVLDRYVAGVGGRDALLLLKTRAAEGTWAHMGLTTASDGRPAAVNRGKVDPFTVTTVGADGLLVTRMGFDGATAIADRAAGKTTITIQGSRGVAQTGATQQELGPASIASQMLNFGLDRELKLAADAGTFAVADPVELEGRTVNVLTRTLQGGTRERFYFDAVDGLLRRRDILRPLLLGDDLIQVDYDDYRIVDGIRVPFTIKTSYLDDNHYGNTIEFSSIRHNAPGS